MEPRTALQCVASLPRSSAVGLPLERLRQLQSLLTAHPWLLALPELAAFRSFVHSLAECSRSGEAERALRVVESEERCTDGRDRLLKLASQLLAPLEGVPHPCAHLPPESADGNSIGSTVGVNGGAESRDGCSASVFGAFGPTVHLISARLGPELVDGRTIEPYALMYVVGAHENVDSVVARWPAREPTTVPMWNSARRLTMTTLCDPAGSARARQNALANLRVEIWDALTERPLGVGETPLRRLSLAPMEVRLLPPDVEGADDSSDRAADGAAADGVVADGVADGGPPRPSDGGPPPPPPPSPLAPRTRAHMPRLREVDHRLRAARVSSSLRPRRPSSRYNPFLPYVAHPFSPYLRF